MPSLCQEAVLSAFEEEGWPPAIDDPLPPQVDQEPKRRLRDTIKSLNTNQLNPILSFRGDGSGLRILWELKEHAESIPVIPVREGIRAARSRERGAGSGTGNRCSRILGSRPTRLGLYGSRIAWRSALRSASHGPSTLATGFSVASLGFRGLRRFRSAAIHSCDRPFGRVAFAVQLPARQPGPYHR